MRGPAAPQTAGGYKGETQGHSGRITYLEEKLILFCYTTFANLFNFLLQQSLSLGTKAPTAGDGQRSQVGYMRSYLAFINLTLWNKI